MRHKKGFNHLGRKTAHRKAMLSNMAASLIIHKRINTTLAKAKALRSYVEPLITRSKDDTMHSRRVVFSHLQNKEAVNELFREISEKIADRPGGYTRILKTGVRLGDDAQMCIIELVDYNTNLLSAKEEDSGKRTRRGRKKVTTTPEEPKSKAKAKVDEIEEVEEVIQDTVEVKKESVEETTEEPKAEVKEEVIEEAVEEPVAEVKEEVVEEVKEEEKEEAPDEEEKPEDNASDDNEEDKKEDEEPSK
ncbi:MAG: 50S ribosomal protein L17 [Bacteroidales bacterium]|nr:50S ribosomal protein L17 [Bacteroidales bacterium]